MATDDVVDQAVKAQQSGPTSPRAGGGGATLQLPSGLGAIPGGGSSDYIGGFPPGYRATSPSVGADQRSGGWHSVSTQLTPRYHVGDEWRPLRNSWSPSQIADLQRKMVDAGLLKKGTFQLGSWDDASRAGYVELLTEANASGGDAGSVLTQLQTNRKMFGATSQKSPFQPVITAPEDIRAMVEATQVKTLGRRLSPAELSAYVTSYQQYQRDVQRQNYDLQGAGDPEAARPGDLRDAASVDSWAEQKVRAEHPDEAQAHDLRGNYDTFISLLGGVV